MAGPTTTTSAAEAASDAVGEQQHRRRHPQSQRQQTFQELYCSTTGDDTQRLQQRQQPVLPRWLVDKCRQCGYEYPTRVQKEALDRLLPVTSPNNNNTNDKNNSSPNVNLIVQSQTGSGKTLAYLLPVLAGVDPSRSALQAIVVVPTRELGLQVTKLARRLASGYRTVDVGDTVKATTTTEEEEEEEDDAFEDDDNPQETNRSSDHHHRKKRRILIMSVLQGSSNRRQRAWAWSEPPHVAIGTPRELCLLVGRRGFKRYNAVRTVVVDEIDACLNVQNFDGSVDGSSSGVSSSASSSSPTSLTATPLHELLSKYLSPTYDDGSIVGSSISADLLDGTAATAGSATTRSAPVVSRTRRTIFCSATIPQPRYFIKQCVQNKWMIVESSSSSSSSSGSASDRPVFIRLNGPPVVQYDTDMNEDIDNDSNTFYSEEQQMQHQQQRYAVPESIRHGYVVCADQDQKFAALRRLLRKIMAATSTAGDTSDTTTSIKGEFKSTGCKKVLVFADANRPLEEMAETLARDLRGAYWTEATAAAALKKATSRPYRRCVVSCLRYEDSLSQRACAMDAFRGDDCDGGDVALRVLLSTDLAARGLDVAEITHVVNYDLPRDADSYLHRAGRTGRMGRPGQVVSVLPPQQEFVLQRLTNQLNVVAKCVGRQQK